MAFVHVLPYIVFGGGFYTLLTIVRGELPVVCGPKKLQTPGIAISEIKEG